jgi:hypothetical protein
LGTVTKGLGAGEPSGTTAGAGLTRVGNAGGLTPAGGSYAATYAVKRYRWTTGWANVTTKYPSETDNHSCLFAVSDTELYLLVDGGITGGRFYRHASKDTWLPTKASMPCPWSTWVSGAYDMAGTIYVITSDSGKLFAYSVAGDSWHRLAAIHHMSTSSPFGSALACDTATHRLYALWASHGSGDKHFRYDIASNHWAARASFPDTIAHPALAVLGGLPYGQGGVDSTFARYVTAPDTDVAACAILVPGDTVHADSTFTPVAVVSNLCGHDLNVEATLTAGEWQSVREIELGPYQTDTVEFDTLSLASGEYEASLSVSCDGDVNAENDVCWKAVYVPSAWTELAAPKLSGGRLEGADSTVYAVERNGPTALAYNVTGDTWSELPQLYGKAAGYDIAHRSDTLYALAGLSDGASGLGKRPAARKMHDAPSGAVILRLALGDTAWTVLEDSLPDMVDAWSWLAATGNGLYLLSTPKSRLYRRDSAGTWHTCAEVPVSKEDSLYALDWDRDDSLFLLDPVGDSLAFWTYAISTDSWTNLPGIVENSESPCAIACDPAGQKVLALVPSEKEPACYSFDRTSEKWTLVAPPPWTPGEGMAFCYSGNLAYALTGGEGGFWSYDPPAGMDRRGKQAQDGVAGSNGQLSYFLGRCRPNPFSGCTEIHWQVPVETQARLCIYDASGQLVKRLADGQAKPGSYTAVWDGTDTRDRRVSTGIYFCRLETPAATLKQKVVLIGTR